MKARGNLRVGAVRMSDTTLRSTEGFAVKAREIVDVRCDVRGPVGGPAAEPGKVGVVVVSGELAVIVPTPPPPRGASSPLGETIGATNNPFARRLHRRAAGARRRFAISAKSRCQGVRRPTSSTAGR